MRKASLLTLPNCWLPPSRDEPFGQKSIWVPKLRQNDFLSPHTIFTSSRKVCLQLGHGCTRVCKRCEFPVQIMAVIAWCSLAHTAPPAQDTMGTVACVFDARR